MAPARVIEVVAREWRAPISQHPDQTSGGHVVLHDVFGDETDPEPSPYCPQPCPQCIEDELPLGMHLDLAGPLLEFPRIEPAARRQSQIDAVVALQVLGRLGWPLPLAILRRRDDRHAHRGPRDAGRRRQWSCRSPSLRRDAGFPGGVLFEHLRRGWPRSGARNHWRPSGSWIAIGEIGGERGVARG